MWFFFRKRKPLTSFYVSLLVIFIDYLGIGLIYPLFSSMLFDASHPILPNETPLHTRGLYLGVLLALMPLFQFFSAPIWGGFSDCKGRRTPLLISIGCGLIGYFTLFLGSLYTQISLFFLGRILTGLSSGNTSIIQAAIADVSDEETKSKKFAFYSMAMGCGFTLGPFFGGILSTISYSLPFLFTFCILLLNFLLALLFFKETLFRSKEAKITPKIAVNNLKKAFLLKETRITFLASFIHCFGWSYFFEFVPLYLIKYYSYSALNLGVFYATAGAFYALCTGVLIQPTLRLFRNEFLFFFGNLASGLSIFLLLFLPSIKWIWLVLFIICYFIAYVSPTSTTIISNQSKKKYQGESLGILSSVNAAAFFLSPLFSGSIIGSHPTLSIKVGGASLILAAICFALYFKKDLFKRGV
jgi:DHA1 family tetracycline resistance protein-like MFS transporter